MTAYDEAVSTAISMLVRLHDCLTQDGDIRKCFSLLPAIAFPLKGITEISSDPDEMFIAYQIMDQLGNVQHVYDGKSDRWYDINRANVDELRNCLNRLTEDLVEPLKKKKKDAVLDSLQQFWVHFHRLVRSLSSDYT